MAEIINNKEHIKVHKMTPHSVEWFAFRQDGIGGSEVGAIMGHNPYKSAIRVYYEKIGRQTEWDRVSQQAFHGTNLEGYVKECWSYHDGTTDGYVENYNDKKTIRKYKDVDGYITNDKYPWLFASLDGFIDSDNGFKLTTGEPLEEDCPLECKTMSIFVEKKWESGIPTSYLYQVHLYMLLTETTYSEICILIDNRRLRVEPVEYNEVIGQAILDASKDFWYNKVVPGKEAVEKASKHEYKAEYELMNNQENIINTLEPPPDESEDYKQFMTETAVTEDIEIKATDEAWDAASMHKIYGAIEKMAKGKKQYHDNRLRKILRDDSAEKISFGEHGYVSFKKNTKGTYILRNSYKLVPTEDMVEKEFNKMDLNSLT